MSKKQPNYTPEFKRQMGELHRVGRGFNELSKENAHYTEAPNNWRQQLGSDSIKSMVTRTIKIKAD